MNMLQAPRNMHEVVNLHLILWGSGLVGLFVFGGLVSVVVAHYGGIWYEGFIFGASAGFGLGWFGALMIMNPQPPKLKQLYEQVSITVTEGEEAYPQGVFAKFKMTPEELRLLASELSKPDAKFTWVPYRQRFGSDRYYKIKQELIDSRMGDKDYQGSVRINKRGQAIMKGLAR